MEVTGDKLTEGNENAPDGAVAELKWLKQRLKTDQMLPPGITVKPTSTIRGLTVSPRSRAKRRSAPICPMRSRGVNTLASFGTITWPISWPWKPAIAISLGIDNPCR